jgi:hypothetical protein
MTNPEVVHPTTQNRIDPLNHDFNWPTDELSEDLLELCKQRCALLQFWRIAWSPFPLKAKHTPIFKPQEAEALSLRQINHSALVFIDLNA